MIAACTLAGACTMLMRQLVRDDPDLAPFLLGFSMACYLIAIAASVSSRLIH